MNDAQAPTYTAVVSCLYCADAAALASWLERAFGFEILRSFPASTGVPRNVELRVGAGEVWLDRKPEAREVTRGASDWIGVDVDDVAACPAHGAGRAKIAASAASIPA
jgi:uncharacterized glyoxalase superfamily protein PhnB